MGTSVTPVNGFDILIDTLKSGNPRRAVELIHRNIRMIPNDKQRAKLAHELAEQRSGIAKGIFHRFNLPVIDLDLVWISRSEYLNKLNFEHFVKHTKIISDISRVILQLREGGREHEALEYEASYVLYYNKHFRHPNSVDFQMLELWMSPSSTYNWSNGEITDLELILYTLDGSVEYLFDATIDEKGRFTEIRGLRVEYKGFTEAETSTKTEKRYRLKL